MYQYYKQMIKDSLAVIGYVSVFAALTTLFATIFSMAFIKVMTVMLPYVL
jgi:preprotein translocase subunit SecE